LERLEAELALAVKLEVLTITVTRIGEPPVSSRCSSKNRKAGGDHGGGTVGT
jgi:hypothetical protein